MTVGEKIQAHRKRLGLSQEELGKRLCVSRQTVSLWEKDQTLPTIDNLMQLKTVFCVSVDDLLDENEAVINQEEPAEAYQFTFSMDELHALAKMERAASLKKQIFIMALWLFLGLWTVLTSSPEVITGAFFCGFLLMAISLVRGIKVFNKTWKASGEIISRSVYQYEIYEQFLIIRIFRDNEMVRMSKYQFSDIERIWLLGNFRMLQVSGQRFIFKEAELNENSVLRTYSRQKPVENPKRVVPTKWKALSIVLFVASLLSIFGPIISFGYRAVKNLNMEGIGPQFLSWTVIPIASIAFGVFMKTKGYSAKRNIIVGAIMTAVLCFYGCAFLFFGQ